MDWPVVIFANNGIHRGGFHQQVVFVAASVVFRLCDDCLGGGQRVAVCCWHGTILLYLIGVMNVSAMGDELTSNG